MIEFLENSAYFGLLITLAFYGIGVLINKRIKLAITNPLLIANILIICFLAVSDIEYSAYNEGAKYISYLLTPATICLAVPLYERFELLKHNYKAVLIGICSGVLTCMLTVFGMALLFRLEHADYVAMLPKSITTAIGLAVSEELGGYVALTAAAIILTGMLGNVCARFVCRVCKIEEPIARGVAIGTTSHAIGTSKAMEIGEVEGAISSLSMVVAGLLTVLVAGVFASFI